MFPSNFLTQLSKSNFLFSVAHSDPLPQPLCAQQHSIKKLPQAVLSFHLQFAQQEGRKFNNSVQNSKYQHWSPCCGADLEAPNMDLKTTDLVDKLRTGNATGSPTSAGNLARRMSLLLRPVYGETTSAQPFDKCHEWSKGKAHALEKCWLVNFMLHVEPLHKKRRILPSALTTPGSLET